MKSQMLQLKDLTCSLKCVNMYSMNPELPSCQKRHLIPNPGIKAGFPVLQADSLMSEPPGKPFMPVIPFNSTVCLVSNSSCLCELRIYLPTFFLRVGIYWE